MPTAYPIRDEVPLLKADPFDLSICREPFEARPVDLAVDIAKSSNRSRRAAIHLGFYQSGEQGSKEYHFPDLLGQFGV